MQPDDDIPHRAEKMLSRAIAVRSPGSPLTPLASDKALRQSPEIAELLTAPDELRAEVILQLCARETSQWIEGRLLGIVSKKRLALDADQLIRVLAAHPSWVYHAITSTLGLLEFNYQRLEEPDQGRVKVAVQRLIAQFSSPSYCPQELIPLQRLIGEDSLDVKVLSSRQGVGPRTEEIVSTVDSSDASTLAFLDHFLTLSNRRSAQWMATATAVATSADGAPAIVAQVLQAALEACVADPERSSWLQSPSANLGDEGILLNALAYAGILRDQANIPTLRDLTAKCMEFDHGVPRSLTVANTCVKAIEAIGGDCAKAALHALSGTVKHGALRREAANAIKSLAASEEQSPRHRE